MGTRRTRQLSPWGEGILQRLRSLDRTVVELAAGLGRSTSTVYRWLATTPPSEVQRAVDAWLYALDAWAVEWELAPQGAEEAGALATRIRVLADRAVHLARRRSADQTSVIDTMRMLEHLARQTFPLVAAANLLSVVLRYSDAALGAWTAERDPTLLWVSGGRVWSALSGSEDPAALAGRRLSTLNPGMGDELGPELERLVETRSRSPLHARSKWSKPNCPAVWTESVWYGLQSALNGTCGLWTVYRLIDGTTPGPAASFL